MVRTISSRITMDNETEYKKQLELVNSALRTMKSEMQLTEAQFKDQANTVDALTAKDKILRQEIEQQQEKIRSLEQAVTDCSEIYGDADKRTDKYKQSLNQAKAELIKMTDELEDNTRYLREAEESADRAAKSIDKFGREAKDSTDDLKDAGGGLDRFLGKLDDLKGVIAGGAVVGGVKAVSDAIFGVVESTEEYRKVMGTLETSSQAAGYSTEETAEAYDRLRSVLGDTQTAATTTANLQAIGVEQERLMSILDGAIGAWATYGDSIPIDGLSESINETIKAGQVTGTFADLLNWGAQEGETYGVKLRESNEANKEWNDAVMDAKSAEDFFNLALQDCKTESERTDLVLQAMSNQGLQKTADAWVENNKDIVAMNESQAKLEEAMGRMGELLTPLAASLVSFGADALGFVIEKVQMAVDWFDKLFDKLKDNTAERAQSRIDREKGRYVDGSNANGLDRVPYDGYVSELHADEAVLTAEEAKVWRAMRRDIPAQSTGVTGQELRQALSSTVNALGAMNQDSGRYVIEVRMNVDGKEFYRETIDDFRLVAKESPDVEDDR